MRFFELDLEANKIALSIRLSRKTINRYLVLIRQRIAEHCEQKTVLHGDILSDNIYFGERQVITV